MKRFCAVLTITLALASAAGAQEKYTQGPDSEEHPDVPKGEVIKFRHKSTVFAGTERDVAVYIPKQYDGKTPACVMVFQDGVSAYLSPKGSYRATVVMDNLINKKEIPVMVGIFIDPGSFDMKGGKNGTPDRKNRSFEYDTLSNQYVTLLEKEIFPTVVKDYKLNLRQDAAGRGICGASSGGICAFTAAWERPDMFSKVLSHIGSFTNIRGGDRYPGIIRAAKKKDIRVFLQDGSGDLDNKAGNWYLANLQMESAFKFAKYDHKTVWGTGKHDGNHGGAILPDSMRWLWRDTPPAPVTTPGEPKKSDKTGDSPKSTTPDAPQTQADAIPEQLEQRRPIRGRLFQGRLRLFR